MLLGNAGNIVKLRRHTGRDSRQTILPVALPVALRVNANPFQTDLCRYLAHTDVIRAYHPWLLGSGNPCRYDEFFLNLTLLGMQEQLKPLLQ